MPQFVMPRRVSAEDPATLTTTVTPQHEPSKLRCVVALGWICHGDGYTVISRESAGSTGPDGS